MPHKIHKQYRLPGHAYAQSGEYFITICTKDRMCTLGEILAGNLCLTPAGEAARRFLLEIPHRFPGIDLDEWVVMPNHAHLILVIHSGRNAPRRVPTVEKELIHPLSKNSVSSVVNRDYIH